jgi:soluble lytic murein transglycosylase-like protein
MATGNHLTIRDYFDQTLLGRIAQRKSFSQDKANASGTQPFHQILTSLGSQRINPNNLKPTGMTAADYRNNLFRKTGQFNHPSTKAPAEEDAVKAPAETALMPTEASVEKPAATSSSGKNLSGPPDASEAISPNRQTSSNESQVIESSVLKAAGKYDLPPGLIKAVIRAESNFQVDAVSRAGAQGLMQLMPATAKELGVENPFDIEQNIDGGACYLRKMMDSFGGDVKVALAAYNAGPGAVQKYGGTIPPYQETERYVNRVLRFSGQMT